MGHYKIKIKLFSIFLVGSLISCTGMNLRSWPLPAAPNTHPAQEYGVMTVMFKGGGVWHNNSIHKHIGPAKHERTGRACSASYLYLVALGDSSIETAKSDGAVSDIAMVEQEIFSILGGLYHRHCTIVIGE